MLRVLFLVDFQSNQLEYCHNPKENHMARKLNDRTQGLKNFVQRALDQIKEGNSGEAELTLVDLINDIGGAYVCVMRKPKKSSPVSGKWNPMKETYHAFLVRNNCD